MNKQVTHIIYAHLILASLASIFFIASKLPSTISTEQSGWCGTDAAEYNATIKLSDKGAQGKILFMKNCASCHHVEKRSPVPL